MGLLKQILPPVLYTSLKNVLHRSSRLKIDSKNRFPGKVFCVGFNKTGTTSVEQVLGDFGYSIGEYAVASMLLLDWHKKEYDRLIRFCQIAQAFQDVPFSLPKTYLCLDEAFPDAKFILTVRDSEDQWFQSLVRFHTKRFSSDKSRAPDRIDLENTPYPYNGFILDIMKMVYRYPTIELYDYEYYTSLYKQHNQEVVAYFKDKPNKLLVLNVSQPNAYQDLAAFLNVTAPTNKKFPWKNKT